MVEFVTAFEISRESNGVWSDTIVRLAIGIFALLIGLTGLFLRWRRTEARWKGWLVPILVIAWSFVWIVGHDFRRTLGHIGRLREAYATGRYQVVEGDVRVMHLAQLD